MVEAATRGDGDVGEIVTHNTRAIGGIPENIQYEDRLVVDVYKRQELKYAG